MDKLFSDEKRNELFKKRKYYSEHPEEAHEEALKRKDDFIPVGIMPKKTDKSTS